VGADRWERIVSGIATCAADGGDGTALVRELWGTAGIPVGALSANARDLAITGHPVPVTELRPGDLVFWSATPGDIGGVTRVGLYLGGDEAVISGPAGPQIIRLTPADRGRLATAVRVADLATDPVRSAVGGLGAVRH
jgi:hypothetical protein